MVTSGRVSADRGGLVRPGPCAGAVVPEPALSVRWLRVHTLRADRRERSFVPVVRAAVSSRDDHGWSRRCRASTDRRSGCPEGAVRWIRWPRDFVRESMSIHDILRSQDGLITREQALAAGMTKGAIEYRLARGDWFRVRPSVFLSAQHPMTDRTRVRAEMLWLGPDATLTGPAAAWWWRLTDQAPSTVRAAVPPWRRVRCPPGTVAERRELAESDRVNLDGLAVTTRALTVLDAVCELGVTAGADLMDRALVRGRVGLADLRDAHHRVLGRRGAGAVATLLPLAGGGARFAAERRLHRLLRGHGIDGWVANHSVVVPGYGVAVLDVAFPELRVFIEVDGWAYHRDLDAFRRDPRRQNALVLAGWFVLRVTWHDLVAAPNRVGAQVEAALRRGDRGDRSFLPAV